jgi:hypothetical protein
MLDIDPLSVRELSHKGKQAPQDRRIKEWITTDRETTDPPTHSPATNATAQGARLAELRVTQLQISKTAPALRATGSQSDGGTRWGIPTLQDIDRRKKDEKVF